MRNRWMTAWILVALGLLLLPVGSAYATKDIADREGLVCTTCHDKPGSKLLTDKGKYYELLGSLDGFEDVTAAFASCTYCHVKKPGSKKLTKAGRSFAFAVNDMEGLRRWLRSAHPGMPGEEEPQAPPQDVPAAPVDESGGPGGGLTLVPAH